jgi:hypothetical protein
MTLLIASIRRADVVLTADGRCTHRANGKVTSFDDHYQKIHPIPEHPLAVAHHGENLINGKPVKELLAEFFKTLNAGNHTVLEIGDLLQDYARPAIRRRLKALAGGAASGFWVIGFGSQSREPFGMEAFWKWDDHLTSEEREWKPITVVAGGDGKKQIPPLDYKVIETVTVEKVRKYHKSLMDTALKTKMQYNSVGGHVHELVINREKWEWTIAP